MKEIIIAYLTSKTNLYKELVKFGLKENTEFKLDGSDKNPEHLFLFDNVHVEQIDEHINIWLYDEYTSSDVNLWNTHTGWTRIKKQTKNFIKP